MGKQLELSTTLVLFFVVVLAAQAADKPKTRTLFADWLDKSTATVLQKAHLSAAPAYGYDELEEEIGCLQNTRLEGCRCIGCLEQCFGCEYQCCAKAFYQPVFTCAPEEGDYKHKSEDSSDFLGSTSLDVAYCDMVVHDFSENINQEIVVAANVTKWGTFIATCYLNKGAELCGHPFCDEMVVTVEGSAFYASYIASHSIPSDITFCAQEANRADVPGSKKTSWQGYRHPGSSKKKAPGKAGKASVAQYAGEGGSDGPEGYYGPEGKLWLGESTIFSGPMRVTSRKYNLKTDQHGWFEFVADWNPIYDDNGPASVDASAAGDLFVVKPYGATLKFSKAHEGYYKQEGPGGDEYKRDGYGERPGGYEEKY